jgi:hypothetical protein
MSQPFQGPDPEKIAGFTSAGVHDYNLGGHDYTESDKAMGDWMTEYLPWVPQGMRIGRWSLQYFVQQFAEAGITHYIDLATGYPSDTYPHTHLPPESKIIYNDIDPRVVDKARKMLGDQPNMRYVQSNMRDIRNILTVAEELFGDERRVGISMVGVIFFLNDDEVREVFDILYDWCAPGSMLATSTFTADPNDQGWQITKSLYDAAGFTVHTRSPDEVLQLVGRWQLSPDGFPRAEVLAERALGASVALLNEGGQFGYSGLLIR